MNGGKTDLIYRLRICRKEKTDKTRSLFVQNGIVGSLERMVSLIEPVYPTGERGRPPIGCERMLRMLLVQGWYNLSDEGMEDAIYDSKLCVGASVLI